MIDTITVGQYQDLYQIQKSDLDELDKITESVAVLSGKTSKEVDEMPVMDFNKLAAQVNESLSKDIPKVTPKKILKCEKDSYGLIYEPANLNRGQYVTMLHFVNGDVITNCHLILASISYNPQTKKHEPERHAEIAEDIKTAKFIDVYAACVFFCDLFRASINSLQGYLVREAKLKGMNPEMTKSILMNLTSVMDGFIPQSGSQTLKT